MRSAPCVCLRPIQSDRRYDEIAKVAKRLAANGVPRRERLRRLLWLNGARFIRPLAPHVVRALHDFHAGSIVPLEARGLG